MLFTFYPDEISFQAQDFIGLTEEEATLFKSGATARICKR
jgi:hypothetical protein